MKKITISVNGSKREFNIDGDTPLLWVLRDELKLTGTKYGCGRGLCGACTVHINGEETRSCITAVENIQGREITTIEGIATGSTLHPIQQAYLENAALQCGICTPGFIVASKALLDQNPNPTEHEIRFWLANNLCRCTGYDKIIRAVQDAAVKMQKARA